VFAIRVLQQRGFHIQYLVVGEANACNKLKRVLTGHYFPLGDTVIVQGFDSKKEFPTDDSVPCAIGNNNELDLDIPQTSVESYKEALIEYLSENERPILVLLKPPRELLACLDEIALDLIRKATVYMYGGFNIRTLLNENKGNNIYRRAFHKLFQQLKDVYLYESFYATGQQNSVNCETMPTLYQYMMEHSQSKYVKNLLNWTRLWNQHMLTESAKWKDVSERSMKIYNNIKDHLDFQMVLADQALAVCIENKQLEPRDKVSIDWDDVGLTQLTQLKSDNRTKVYLYRDLSWTELELYLLALI
jgi:hypothetical protein